MKIHWKKQFVKRLDLGAYDAEPPARFKKAHGKDCPGSDSTPSGIIILSFVMAFSKLLINQGELSALRMASPKLSTLTSPYHCDNYGAG